MQRELSCVSTCFCKYFSFAETLVVVLQCYPELQTVMRPCHLCIRVKHVFIVSPYGCCVVHPGFGVNYIQDLGVEEA